MVIVVFHALASAFLYFRDRLRMGYLSPRLRNRNSSHGACADGSSSYSCFRWRFGRRLDLKQDAFVSILDATNVTELREAIHSSVKQCLPRAEQVQVLLKNPATEQIEADGIVLPTHGVIWDAFHQSKPHICSVPSVPDPVLEILHLHPSDPHKVLLLPISRQNNSSLGIVVAYFKSDGLSIEEEKCLNVLVKQDKVTPFQTLFKLLSRNQRSKLEIKKENSDSWFYYNTRHIFEDNLCDILCCSATTAGHGFRQFSTRVIDKLVCNEAIAEKMCFVPCSGQRELHDQDAATLELKVIHYLREQTHAEGGFLLLVVPETLELISQVVGSTILPEEVRFPGLWSCFAQALETKKPMFLEHIPLDRRAEVEKIVEMKVHNFVCVPVARKGSEDLIALACLVNKGQGQRFTETDIQIVRQCFKYTATVLTSTLAFQNERKLKNQTQALLHVARKLFTRLGESGVEENKAENTLNHLFAVNRFISSFRVKHAMYSSENSPEISQLARLESRPGKKSHVHIHGERKHATSSFTTPLVEHDHDDSIFSPVKKFKKKVTIVLQEKQAAFEQLRKSHQNENQKPVKTLPSGHDTHEEEDEALKKMELRRKRNFSVTYFRMYDPISAEAESVSESECSAESSSSSEEEEEMKEETVLTEKKYKKVSNGLRQFPAPPVQTRSATDSLQITTQSSVLSSSDNIRQQGHKYFGHFLRPLTNKLSVHPPTPKLSANCLSSDKLFVKSFVVVGNKQVTITPPQSSTQAHQGSSFASALSDIHQQKDLHKKRKKSALRYSHCKPHESFRHVRALPAESFSLPDGNVCPFIEFLRLHAPNDAMYSDGDFLYDLTKLLREIMQEARNLTDAERCSVFLLDQDSDELVATVFDGITTNNKEWKLRNGVQSEIRLPKTQGIAGHVATTGTLLNIKDAYSHPLFYRGIDDSTGFRTRNILCFPIKDEEGVVLGVAQLCNKKTGTYFTTFDEDIASAFAVYCCISISHSLMYKKVIDIQYRNSLANELMMFHMKCLIYKKLQDTQHRHMLANELMKFHMQQIPTEEVQELAEQGVPEVEVFHKDFDKFCYPPRTLTDSKTHVACLSMFEDLGFANRWRLKRETLARFLLMVKKGYRNPPYHNWMHAFSVAHFGYLCIKNLKLVNYLEDIEMFALFVSCLCHDIDHRGTTNSFQVKSQSVLAALYSSEGSVMERHHLAQSMCILNTEGSNIFENLTSREYQQVLDLMRDIILATDVAHHLRIFDSLEEMARNGYNRQDPKCRNLLLCLLMTASDLSDQTKSWDNTKHIAVLIYQEFFSQGDLEKALGESPLEMMDRERACVPDLQISFLDNIAMPVYKVLAEIFPEAKTVEECVENNRKHWVHKAQLLKVHNNSAQTMSVQEIIALGENDEEKMDTNQQNGR